MSHNTRIKITESLQKRYVNESKNRVIEIEKLKHHLFGTKKNNKSEMAIIFLTFFLGMCSFCVL